MVTLLYQYGDVFDDAYTADALIFPANPKAVVGGSMDRIVYQQAGYQELLAARVKEATDLQPTQVCVTDSFQLHPKYKHLIHAVSPKYTPDHDAEDLLSDLADTYCHALDAAEKCGAKTIVSALLGAGANGFPVKTAEMAAKLGISQYFASRSSKIKQVIVVKYQDEELARKVRECQEHLKQACFLLRDEATGKIDEAVRDSIMDQITRQKTQIKDYLQILDTALFSNDLESYVYPRNFYLEMDHHNVPDSEDVYKDYCETVYRQIVTPAMKNNNAIAEFLNLEKCDLKKLVDNHFNNMRINVLRFGMAACLNTEDFYRLMLCNGFTFPINDEEETLLIFLNGQQEITDPEVRYKKFKSKYWKMKMFQRYEAKRRNKNVETKKRSEQDHTR